MFESPVKITDEIVTKICKDINTFTADFGGTEMYQPLEYVLNCKINPL